jgi:hypothetical protein
MGDGKPWYRRSTVARLPGRGIFELDVRLVEEERLFRGPRRPLRAQLRPAMAGEEANDGDEHDQGREDDRQLAAR